MLVQGAVTVVALAVPLVPSIQMLLRLMSARSYATLTLQSAYMLVEEQADLMATGGNPNVPFSELSVSQMRLCSCLLLAVTCPMSFSAGRWTLHAITLCLVCFDLASAWTVAQRLAGSSLPLRLHQLQLCLRARQGIWNGTEHKGGCMADGHAPVGCQRPAEVPGLQRALWRAIEASTDKEHESRGTPPACCTFSPSHS